MAVCFGLLLGAIGLSTTPAVAAGGKINGKVTDASSGSSLAGVTVTAVGAMTANAVSASDGTFTLKNLTPGSYVLFTSLEGYETAQSDPIPVADGMNQAVSLTLSRQGVAAKTVLGPNLTIPPPLVTYCGIVRAFYFGRTNGNACLTCKTKGSPDATAFNVGGQLHAQVNIPYSPWVLGATYFGAYPFGANWPGPLNNIGYNPQVDNTLPGYPLSVFGEAYLQYKTPGMFGQTGKEILTSQESPWSNPSDSRIEPVSFQGTLLNGNLSPNLNVGGMYMARFKSRVTSSFDANTLLTSCNTAFNTGKGPVPGVSGTFTVPGDPCNKPQKNQGFLQFSASYKFGGSGLVANAYQYQIYDIVEMTYVNAQWNYDKKSKFNPFLAAQYLSENNLGQHLIGTIHDHTYGAQFGATIYHNLNFVAGYNASPFTTYVVPAKNCKGTISSPQSASTGAIFGGVADTSVTGLPAGMVQCYGGGVASPYTDNYATDPLYTTQISQGLADTHKPGTGAKAALTWQSNDKRIKVILSNAWYNYGLPGFSGKTSNGDARAEFNFDVQYFFNPVRSGPYKGLSLRQRYADRTQPFSPYEFKYSRTQLEYAF